MMASAFRFPSQVINQVGAFSLRATLNCEAFATEHSSTAHFDVKSFVGLAWRPAGEPICCGKLFQNSTLGSFQLCFLAAFPSPY